MTHPNWNKSDKSTNHMSGISVSNTEKYIFDVIRKGHQVSKWVVRWYSAKSQMSHDICENIGYKNDDGLEIYERQ